MIEVTQTVDSEAGTITLRFKDQGTDHEYQGRPCHAVALDGADGDNLKHWLRLLGYEHIGCELKPGFTGATHVEYWARVPA